MIKVKLPQVFDGESWRLAFTKTEGGAYKKDYRKMATSPYRGWFRFSGVGHNKITEVLIYFLLLSFLLI